MYKIPVLLLTLMLLLTSCATTTYFVVRHAEKETAVTMTSDVPLSEAGMRRAEALKDSLLHLDIRHIYATNYLRTRSTAAPLAASLGLHTELYDARDSLFTTRLLKKNEGNVLIVGHSNTVDDLVNGLAGRTLIRGDLPETAYGDLFIVTKKGGKTSFSQKHFGE